MQWVLLLLSELALLEDDWAI
jgi:hypothetical protein